MFQLLTFHKLFYFMIGSSLKAFGPGGGDSHAEQTGMLVGNFEFNP